MIRVLTPAWWGDQGEQHVGWTDGTDTYCCSSIPCWFVEVPDFEYWGYFHKSDLTVISTKEESVIRSREEFTRKVLFWCQRNLRECPEPKEVDVLWESLEMQDVTDLLYNLQRDDARSAAEEIGFDLDALEKSGDLPEHFWEDVQKGVEAGLGCWSEVMQTAVEEALSAGGIERSD